MLVYCLQHSPRLTASMLAMRPEAPEAFSSPSPFGAVCRRQSCLKAHRQRVRTPSSHSVGYSWALERKWTQSLPGCNMLLPISSPPQWPLLYYSFTKQFQHAKARGGGRHQHTVILAPCVFTCLWTYCNEALLLICTHT